MFNLVLKDFLLQKKITLLAIAFVWFFNSTSYYNLNNGVNNLHELNHLSIYWIILFTCSSILCMLGSEEKNKSLIIINSLPLKKSQIVISKYISLIFFTAINTFISYLPILLIWTISLNNNVFSLDYSTIILSFLFILILFSLYYPLYFKYGYNNMKTFSFAFFYFSFISPKLLEKLIKNNNPLLHKFINYMLVNPSKTIFIIFILTVLILIVSLYISIEIYKNKDL